MDFCGTPNIEQIITMIYFGLPSLALIIAIKGNPIFALFLVVIDVILVFWWDRKWKIE